jgi:hypothetical protein
VSGSTIKALDKNFEGPAGADGLRWIDARELGIEGRGFEDTARFYDRLPAGSRERVTEAVWKLQQHSAGMAVRFSTSAPEIGVRWKLRFPELAMSHMPATGVSGVDLYAAPGGRLRFAGAGIPAAFPENTARLPGSQDGKPCTFLLYLPLYNGVESVELGVGPGFPLTRAAEPEDRRPLCFYGTSIVHGGCASRPGMAYPAIVGRRLGYPTINLGFSGNGRAEPAIAELLARLDPAAYILDPLPNMIAEPAAERMESMARTLRRAHPGTPIVLVEHLRLTRLPHPGGDASVEQWQRINADLRGVVDRLRRDGVGGIHVVGWQNLLGDDQEGTVDGIHPTDLGFARMAAAIGEVLAGLLAP